MDDAIAELLHCARLGLKGVTLGVFPSGKAYPTREDRFWAVAIDLQMPLTVHVGFDRLGPRASQPTFEYPGADPAVLAKLGPRKLVEWVALPFLGTAPSMSFAQLILSGVFDRLPDLQIFFAETRLGWVPFWMEEADYCWPCRSPAIPGASSGSWPGTAAGPGPGSGPTAHRTRGAAKSP